MVICDRAILILRRWSWKWEKVTMTG